MEKPLIVIGGSKGKFSTCKYFAFIANQIYKYNTLKFIYNEEFNIITKIQVNDKDILNLDELRRDIIFSRVKNDNESIVNEEFNIKEEINLINYLCVRYNIDFIICQYNSLIEFGNIICNGLTTIENHESQDLDYTLNEIFKINYLYNSLYSNETDYISIKNKSVESLVLRNNIPLIMCPHERDITNKLLYKCSLSNTPIFLTNFYHLKYINFNTGVNSRYSYINLTVALTILAYINSIYNYKTKEIEDFKYLKYKKSTYGTYQVYVGMIPNKLPILKSINFDLSYCGVKKYKENLYFYLDNGGSFKSSNLLIDWFNKNTIKKGVNICIFSCDTNINLIRTILPLTNIETETLYIADYNLLGRNTEDIFKDFDLEKNYTYEKRDETNNWTETIYEIFNLFYNDKKYEYGRKRASLQLNEYAGFEEIKTEKYEDILNLKLPLVKPDIVIDDIKSIIEWIVNLSNKNKSIHYNVLSTGSKFLINDVIDILDR